MTLVSAGVKGVLSEAPKAQGTGKSAPTTLSGVLTHNATRATAAAVRMSASLVSVGVTGALRDQVKHKDEVIGRPKTAASVAANASAPLTPTSRFKDCSNKSLRMSGVFDYNLVAVPQARRVSFAGSGGMSSVVLG